VAAPELHDLVRVVRVLAWRSFQHGYNRFVCTYACVCCQRGAHTENRTLKSFLAAKEWCTCGHRCVFVCICMHVHVCMCTYESMRVLLWFACTLTHPRTRTPHAPLHALALTCTHTQINAHIPNTHLGGGKIRKCPRGFPAIQVKRKRLDNVYFCDQIAASRGRPAFAKKHSHS
jgi:hypothetical protein